MPLGKVIYESGAELEHVYFPTPGCIVSMLYVMADGASAEIAVVGDEGMVGIALFMGGGTTPSRALVQSAGQALQLPGDALKREFERHSGLQHLAVALHPGADHADVADRRVQPASFGGSATLPLAAAEPGSPGDQRTHHDPGVDRQHAGRAPRRRHRGGRKTASPGLIHYSRGRITVLDRPGLEARVCECYAVVKKEYDRLLPLKRADQRPRERQISSKK